MDAHWGVYILPTSDLNGTIGVLYSIGVGFCVARSTLNGNARAKNSGTSMKVQLPRFFISMCITSSISKNKNLSSGCCEILKTKKYEKAFLFFNGILPYGIN